MLGKKHSSNNNKKYTFNGIVIYRNLELDLVNISYTSAFPQEQYRHALCITKDFTILTNAF